MQNDTHGFVGLRIGIEGSTSWIHYLKYALGCQHVDLRIFVEYCSIFTMRKSSDQKLLSAESVAFRLFFMRTESRFIDGDSSISSEFSN